MMHDDLKLQQYKVNLSNATPLALVQSMKMKTRTFQIPFRTMDIYMNVLLEYIYINVFKKMCAHSQAPTVNLL